MDRVPDVPWRVIEKERNAVMALSRKVLGSWVTTLRRQLQVTMTEKAGPIESEKDLRDGLALIEKYIETGFFLTNKELEHNLELVEALELKEHASGGAHYRKMLYRAKGEQRLIYQGRLPRDR